tara:strand:- start:429 stop:758 length:330 start_codon:yes stop_codon:yes gene_type:complete
MEIIWEVLMLDRITDTGYVFKANCRCIAQETVNEVTLQGVSYIDAEFTAPIGPDFIPYEDLTEQKVLTWVFNEIGDLKLKKEQTSTTKLNKAITALNPPTEEGVPWVGA